MLVMLISIGLTIVLIALFSMPCSKAFNSKLNSIVIISIVVSCNDKLSHPFPYERMNERKNNNNKNKSVKSVDIKKRLRRKGEWWVKGIDWKKKNEKKK